VPSRVPEINFTDQPTINIVAYVIVQNLGHTDKWMNNISKFPRGLDATIFCRFLDKQ
jgi:hypothetical protein